MTDDPRSPGAVRLSFENFYRAEHVRLIRFLLKLGASPEDAWDITQHCFVKALERWEHISDPPRWIRTTLIREYRRVQARRTEEITRALRGGWEPRPQFDKLDLHSEEAQVYAIIASLPPRQAEVMALTYDDYTPKEIAEILTESYPAERVVTPEAVRASLHQGRARLRQVLTRVKEV